MVVFVNRAVTVASFVNAIALEHFEDESEDHVVLNCAKVTKVPQIEGQANSLNYVCKTAVPPVWRTPVD